MYRPTPKQLRFLDWETGMFFHFGIRSFYPGHRDWDGKEMDPSAFDPKELDVHDWLANAKRIGAKYAILTTKHHDGFALWPSKYTAYSVAASPWKGGKGDVVKEFVCACREEGIAVGLYYSPAQWGSHSVEFKSGKEYDDYFIGQISELLTGYGKIDYLWFDGCGSGGHEYDQKRIVSAIRSLQPDILIFDMWDGDTRWVGNEDGYAPYPNPYAVKHWVLGEEKTLFIPAECDCKLRESWFYDLNEDTIKSTEELLGMYELSVGRGCNFLLNVGPDDRGLISEADGARLKEFAQALDRLYAKPLPFEAPVRQGENTYVIAYGDGTQKAIGQNTNLPPVRRVVLKEDLTEGQKIRRFRLYAHVPSVNPVSATKFCIYTGETVGHKLIVPLPAVRTGMLEMEILESEGTASLTGFAAY